VLLAVLVLTVTAGDPRSAAASTQAKPANDEWIAGTRFLLAGAPATPDGALAQYPDRPLKTINPYWASYAAMGLARSGEPKYVRYAWA